MQDKKLNQQIIGVIIITLILAIVAIVITVRNNNEEQRLLEESQKAEQEEVSNPQEEIVPINSYCDQNKTPKKTQLRYKEYITISAIDDNGCVLINSTENKEYISKQTRLAYNSAQKNQESFHHNNNINSGTIKADQVTIKNEQGNILGWVQVIIYGDGKNSGRYALSPNGEWIYIGV